MIEIKNLNKSFGDNVIFDNFNVTINDGEYVVFAGKSGCGKTTLLNIIGALEKPDSGKVLVKSVDIYKKKNQKEYFKNTVGFLFQNFALVENKTVRQNLEFIEKKARTEQTVEQVLQRVGLSDKIDTPVYKLSGGEQQRVALARLMLKKCSIILADEPTGSLDRENADRVLDILKILNEEGKTIILVTHDERIISTAKRVVNL
ncbi:MAG: ABC transporter ATP-binding protein [Ruminococcaceae bacterium]|nr:ABC transporter ATP-binding protein [Oscillospiraceae bacterium]